MKLSQEAYNRAVKFINDYAREVDRSYYKFSFENGDALDVLQALRKYQNKDGGFGHGIEPDFRTPTSSAMATSVGLQYCIAVNAQAGHPIIGKAIKYLINNYNSGGGYWPATDLSVNDAPHAPWWHLASQAPPKEEAWANPSAELLGYLYCYQEDVPTEFLQSVTRRAQVNLAYGNHMLGSMRWYTIACWQRALPYLPEDLRAKVLEQIAEAAARVVPLTHEKLQEVHISMLAPAPETPFAQAFPDEVRELLQVDIPSQAEDGGWYPTWEWGQYPEAWEVARLEWAGKLTLHTLLALRSFDLIEQN